jgi:hypothetical protein
MGEGELNFWEGVEVKGSLVVRVHQRAVGGLELPLRVGVVVREMAGPKEE